MAEATITCPKCGHANPGDASDCENCGITFAIYEAERQANEAQKDDTIRLKDAEKPAAVKEAFLCPNCGHNVRPDVEECLSCGVIFAKAFEIRERELGNAPDKLAALKDQRERHRKALAERKQKEEAERAEQQRRRRENEENVRRRKEEQRRAEALQRQQALAEKAEALRRQMAEIEKQMALEIQVEEQAERENDLRETFEAEKNQALDLQAEVFEKSLTDLQRELRQDVAAAVEQYKAELDKKRQAYLQAVDVKKAEALARQQESFEKAQHAWRQEADEEQARALESQKAEFEATRARWLAEAEQEKQAALARQQAELEAEAAAFQQQIEAEVSAALSQQCEQMQAALDNERQNLDERKAEARRCQEADLARNQAAAKTEGLQEAFAFGATFTDLLKQAEGQTVGINDQDPEHLRRAVLLYVGDDYFSVYGGGVCHSYPMDAVAGLVRSVDGLQTPDEPDAEPVFLVVQLSA